MESREIINLHEWLNLTVAAAEYQETIRIVKETMESEEFLMTIKSFAKVSEPFSIAIGLPADITVLSRASTPI